MAEAGTGIGKSLSLCPGAIPVARLTQKKLVISTATVALQNSSSTRIFLYHRHSELPFRFMLVKGASATAASTCWSRRQTAARWPISNSTSAH